MVKPWRVILAAALIFVAGAITGAAAMRYYTPARAKKAEPNLPVTQERRHDYVSKLDRELDLTPEQRQQIEAILAESQQRIKALWQQIEPKTKEEYQRCRKEIAENLTPEQREKMKALRHGKEKPAEKPGEAENDKSGEKKAKEKKEACARRNVKKAC